MANISIFAMHTAYLLGFKRIADVRGVSSITKLFENNMSRCGLYLQIRPNNELYIGQTANLPARHERHLANGVVVNELAFMPVQPKLLNEKEKELITKAERLGLPLNNLALRSDAKQTKPVFSELFPEDWVKQWLMPSAPESDAFRQIYSSMHNGLRHQLDLARAHPVWPQILPVARQVVSVLIPKPTLSAGYFWSADAYTKRLNEPFLPLIRLHASSHTILQLGVYHDIPHIAWGQLTWPALNMGISNDEILAYQKEMPYVKVESTNSGWLFSTSASLIPQVAERLQSPLRESLFALFKEPLLKKGNPALEHLLTHPK